MVSLQSRLHFLQSEKLCILIKRYSLFTFIVTVDMFAIIFSILLRIFCLPTFFNAFFLLCTHFMTNCFFISFLFPH